MIKVENLSVRVGSFALADVSFEIATGEYGVLMGKTGCGKTTILEAVCGLKRASQGRILLMGREVTRLHSSVRGIGYVPQDVALFNTMTVYEHLAFGPMIHRWRQHAIHVRVQELAEELGILHLLERKPKGLSGGERQRVALGRALSMRPGILCMDEPLSALDEETHEEICELLRRIRLQTGVTVLHVTHSRREAELLADRIYLLRNGKIGHGSEMEDPG